MTTTTVRVAFAIASAVCSFLLIQTEVQAYPVVLLVLGAINVALAAASPFVGNTDTPAE